MYISLVECLVVCKLAGRKQLRHMLACRPGNQGWVGLTAQLEVWAEWVHADDDAKLSLHLVCEKGKQALSQQRLGGNGILQRRQGAVQFLISEQPMHLYHSKC